MGTPTTTVILAASFTLYQWGNDEDEFPTMNYGFCDPSNPWGTLPRSITESTEWPEGYQERLTVTMTVEEAAEFIADFPGGVWNFCEGEASTIDYGTGLSAEVTLFVDGEGAADALSLADAQAS